MDFGIYGQDFSKRSVTMKRAFRIRLLWNCKRPLLRVCMWAVVACPPLIAAQNSTPTPPATPVTSSAPITGNLTLACSTPAVAQQTVTCNIAKGSGAGTPYTGTLNLDPQDPAVLLAPLIVGSGGSASFTLALKALPTGTTSQPVTLTFTDAAGHVQLTSTITVEAAGYNGGEVMRLVGGVDEAFAPSAQPVGKLFADMYLELGIGCGSSHQSDLNKPKRSWICNVPGYEPTGSARFGSPWRYWISAGLLSTSAAATSANVSALTGTTGGLTGLSYQSVESFALDTGVSRRIWQTGFDLNGVPQGLSDTAVELIAGGGFTTPVNSATPPPVQVYCTEPSQPNPGCPALSGPSAPTTPLPAGDQYLVVHPPIRTSFFSNWAAGFRFETFYENHSSSFQPAITDITIGQDQAVTDGKLGRAVFHFEGFWPLPSPANTIFLIFGGSVRVPGSNIGFQPVTNYNYTPVSISNYTGPLTGPGFVQNIAPIYAADNFRVGVAVNVVALVSKWLSP